MRSAENSHESIDHETWLIDAGHKIIEKRRRDGAEALGPRERLIYALWVADYSMRNAGDLSTARDLDDRFREGGRDAAAILELPSALAAFSLSDGELERRYFDLFSGLCAELRAR